MEYLSLKTGNLLTILFPLNFIVMKVMAHITLFYNNKVMKIIKMLFAIIGIITATIFYFIGYNNYFCFTWLVITVLFPLYYEKLYKSIYKKKEDCMDIRKIDNLFGAVSIISGIIIIILSCTKIFYIIGGGGNIKIDIISRILYVVWGMCFIVLNKYVMCRICIFAQK